MISAISEEIRIIAFRSNTRQIPDQLMDLLFGTYVDSHSWFVDDQDIAIGQ